MRPSIWLQHLLNVVVPAIALAASGSLAPRLFASGFLFFGVFSLMHDAMHGALRLPRAWNERLLSLSAALLGVSGQAARWFHMRHHADLFGPDDLEAPAPSLGWTRLALTAPFVYLALPVRGWKRAPRRKRQLLEWLAVAAAAFALASSAAGRAYLAVAGLAQLTIPIWGGRLPHQPSPRLLALLRRLAWTRSPLVLGFVFHLLHHERPRLSIYELPARATPLPRSLHFRVDETLRRAEKCEARMRPV